jgi:hypothetical protein
MGVLAAKLHAIATMISLPETWFNIFIIHFSAGIPSHPVRTCLFRKKLWSLQSIHTELAKLYSEKVISRMVCPANLFWGR